MKANIIEDKQKALQILQSTSLRAILQTTEDGLNKTKTHNAKIISKFRALIEE